MHVDPALDLFEAASSSLIEARALQTRVDTKFVMPAPTAARLLAELAADYAVVTAGGARIASYETLYFDSPRLDLFHAHRRGVRCRQKIRIRHYPDRGLAFLEVKSRLGNGRTSKARLPVAAFAAPPGPEEAEFLRSRTSLGECVTPQTRVDFRRISLVSHQELERVTLDFGLELTSGRERVALPGVVILEVKQAAHQRHSPALRTLRAAGLRPGWASKYCLSICLLRTGVRHNSFGPDLRAFFTSGERGAA